MTDNTTGTDRDRADRVVRDARTRPGVSEARRDGTAIVLWFDDQPTLSESFIEWADKSRLVIRDVVVFPDEDSFSVQLAFVESVKFG